MSDAPTRWYRSLYWRLAYTRDWGAHNVMVGLHVGDMNAIKYWSQKGIHLLSGGADLDILLDGCMNLGKSMREAVS